MHIVVSEFIDEAALNQIGSDATVDYNPGLVENRPRLLDSIHIATGLIVRNRTQVDAELLAAAPHLKVVGRLGVGLDNIDLDACASRNRCQHIACGRICYHSQPDVTARCLSIAPCHDCR